MTDALRSVLPAALSAAALLTAGVYLLAGQEATSLPQPDTKGKTTLAQALARRRSIRHFSNTALTGEQISQLCWSAQGVTDTRGYRTAPSAGATYPLGLYVATADGVQRYVPGRHALVAHIDGDVRKPLAAAALGQLWVAGAPAVFVIAADVQRTARRYGKRAERYVWMEVGHAAQNLLLQATALGLGSVPVGAFEDDRVAESLQLPASQRPLYILPVGRPKQKEK